MDSISRIVKFVRAALQLQVKYILLYSLLEQRFEVVLAQFEQVLTLVWL